MGPHAFWDVGVPRGPTEEIETARKSSVRLQWWRRWESNPQPPACKAGALPIELRPHKGRHHDSGEWQVNTK